MSAEQVLNHFNVKKEVGLNASAVKQKISQHGKNKLVEKKSKSLIVKFLAQFSDFMVIILLIAAVISFFTSIYEGNKDYIDSIIILVIVIMNATVGVIQENKAEKAIEALKKLSSPKAAVIRNGSETFVNSEDLVPGDILILKTGDLVPADARLIESHNLKVEESSLTGESAAVEKNADAKVREKESIADRTNMVFSTSTITSGNGVAVVVETGMNTQVGKIAGMIIKEEAPLTPLQVKLQKISKLLGIVAVSICFVIFILGVIQKVEPLEMFMIAISLAVAAIPEGLPAVVTIVLAMGIRRMAANRAIIRKLPAVETLGSATVICSDKTGTLTQNKMTVTTVCTSSGRVSLTSGESVKILSLSALCNDAKLEEVKGKSVKFIGEATEKALVQAAFNIGKNKKDLEKTYPRVDEIPFDSSRKLMTTIHKLGGGKYRCITKGAPDVLLKLCTQCDGVAITSSKQNNIIKLNNNMAADALRVLAIAYKDIAKIPKNKKELESGLNFCGLVGLIDPPRPTVRLAVSECKNAGIKPVMITGDHVITAKAIAKDLGIMQEGDRAMTGVELEKTSQQDLENNIYKYSVFARVSPEHKVRIVKAFQKRGESVAMTGDGVNDAPALKVADIGCAMGITGTDVAKSASDMIMTDDNFATIVEAVRQGRGIFENIKKTIHFLLSSNIGEIITVLTAFLLRLPSPLLAIQLLWVNLVTDSLPALALGVEPVDREIMTQNASKDKTSLFSKNMWKRIVMEGCFIGAISILAFTIGRVFFDTTITPVIGRTMAFAVLSLSQLVHAFNVRNEKSIFKTDVFGNIKLVYSTIICVVLQVAVISLPTLSLMFKTANLTPVQWLIVALLSLSPLVIVELEKFFYSKDK